MTKTVVYRGDPTIARANTELEEGEQPHVDEYHGSDFGDGDKPLVARPGDELNVSDEKAAQLLRDFPDRFEEAEEPQKSPTKAPPGEDAPPA